MKINLIHLTPSKKLGKSEKLTNFSKQEIAKKKF